MLVDMRMCYVRVVMEFLGFGDILVVCGMWGLFEDFEYLDYEFFQKKFEEEYGSVCFDIMD